MEKITNEPDEDLVIVARFGNAPEAHLALTKLESEGIEAYLGDEYMMGVNPGYDIALGGVKLRTKKSEAERARRILGEK